MDQIQGMKQGNLGFDVGKSKAREKQIKPGLNNTMTKWGSSKIRPGQLRLDQVQIWIKQREARTKTV